LLIILIGHKTSPQHEVTVLISRQVFAHTVSCLPQPGRVYRRSINSNQTCSIKDTVYHSFHFHLHKEWFALTQLVLTCRFCSYNSTSNLS